VQNQRSIILTCLLSFAGIRIEIIQNEKFEIENSTTNTIRFKLEINDYRVCYRLRVSYCVFLLFFFFLFMYAKVIGFSEIGKLHFIIYTHKIVSTVHEWFL